MQIPPIFTRKPLASSLPGFLFLILIILLPAITPALCPAVARQTEVNLTILHVNDTHGHILPAMDKSIDSEGPVGGAEYLAKMIESERAANPTGTLLLSAGDMFQGTPISALFRGKPVIEIMNYLKYDAMVLGNHEFDWGRAPLQSIISETAFPVLSANILDQGGRLLHGVKPYVMVKRKNVQIAIIGLTTPETIYTTTPGSLTGLTFVSPQKVLPPLIKKVRAHGAKLIIVLSHLGLDADRELARQVQGIDVIVGGHSHTAIPDPINESGTVIVQAGSNGSYLGELNISFDTAKKKIVDYTRKNELKLVSTSSGAQFDPNVARIVDKYDSQIRAEFSKVIGTAAVNLTNEPSTESNLGDLIADAMRESTGASIAFMHGGGIRADLPKGPLTLEMIYTVLPFDNTIMSVELTGEQIRNALEKSPLSEKLLQVSGIKVQYDISRPAGAKVVSALVDGRPLDPGAVYRVAINDFLAAGGDQFTVFKQGANMVPGPALRDAVLERIRNNSPISIQKQERIVFRN